VRNWHHETDLSLYDISWVLLENGNIIGTGNRKQYENQAGATEILTIDYGKPVVKAGGEYILRISFSLNRIRNGHEKGS
jgi:hypothetical protein